MNKYLLDTSFVIKYIRGQKNAIEFIDQTNSEISSSYICLAELYEGIYHSKSPETKAEPIDTFFSGLGQIYGIDKKISQEFGQLRAKLRKTNQLIDDLDILIAATCLIYRLNLVTYNPKHFKRIPNLKVIEPN